MDFFLDASVAPFVAALIAVFIFGVVELILGGGLSQLADTFMDMDTLRGSQFMNWLLVKDLPLAASMALVLAGFGITGLVAQALCIRIGGAPQSLWMVGALAAAGGLAFARGLGKLVGRLRLVHSSALEPSEYIGRTAKVLSPEARAGFAAQASFVDQHGQTHYVMVEPRERTECFAQGDTVVLTERASTAVFYAKRQAA